MKIRLLAALGLAIWGAPASHGDTTIGTPISKLPANLSKPGHYRLVKNLTLGAPATAAITISAPNVVLDMNGFSIAEKADVQTGAVGIRIEDAASPVTLRNGIIQGFTTAVDRTAGGLNAVVEDLRCLDQHSNGIKIGGGSFVRRCKVSGTGMTGQNAASTVVGILVGGTAIVEDCAVIDVGDSVTAGVNNIGINSGGGLVRNCVLTGRGTSNLFSGILMTGAARGTIDRCQFTLWGIGVNVIVGGIGFVAHATVRDSTFDLVTTTLTSGATDAGGNSP